MSLTFYISHCEMRHVFQRAAIGPILVSTQSPVLDLYPSIISFRVISLHYFLWEVSSLRRKILRKMTRTTFLNRIRKLSSPCQNATSQSHAKRIEYWAWERPKSPEFFARVLGTPKRRLRLGTRHRRLGGSTNGMCGLNTLRRSCNTRKFPMPAHWTPRKWDGAPGRRGIALS